MFRSVYKNVIVLNAMVVVTAALFCAFSLSVFFTEIETYLVIIYTASSFLLNITLYLPPIASGFQYN